MDNQELEEFFEENHKLLWLFTLYHTYEKIFLNFLREKNTPEEKINEIIILSKEFKNLYPAKFLELSKE